jgi:hypothetical protein
MTTLLDSDNMSGDHLASNRMLDSPRTLTKLSGAGRVAFRLALAGFVMRATCAVSEQGFIPMAHPGGPIFWNEME